MDDLPIIVSRGAFANYVLLLGIAAVTDLRKFIIPNLVSLALFLAFIPVALLQPIEIDWLSHFGAAALCLVVGAVFFALRWFGAGDVKLLAAVAFWAGFPYLLHLMVYVGLAGGAFALLLLLLRFGLGAAFSARSASETGGETTAATLALPPILRVGERVPYGVAITLGAIFLAFRLPYTALYL